MRRRPLENSYPGLGNYALNLVRTRARELVRSGRFTSADYDDLEQELVIDLLRRFPKFYPAFAKEVTFVQRIVDHKVASLIAAESAMVRGNGMHKASLHQEVEDADGDSVERWETLDEARYLRGSSARKEAERCDLRLDLASAIADFPARLRALCLRLQQATLTEVAQAKGVSRSTLYAPIRKLRSYLEEAGLTAYIPALGRNGAVGERTPPPIPAAVDPSDAYYAEARR